ncbi:MAG: hypothetical protein EHM78_19940 [Myxococcaceae bacterium]|nr:MAG: hypothetical protein EHM78_19940 [Myxococcaceae bacterium]
MPSPAILRTGSVCAAAFAATFVWVTASRAGHPDPSPLARALVDPTVQGREWVLFWALLAMPAIFVALHEHLGAGPRAGWSRAGLIFLMVFTVLEVSHRGVLLVAGPALAKTALGEGAEAIAASVWLLGLEQSVRGIYVPLLAAHGLGSIAVAVAAQGPGPERLLRWAFIANAIRLGLRLAQSPGGLAELRPLNAALLGPVLTLVYAGVAVALWQLAGPVALRRPGALARARR